MSNIFILYNRNGVLSGRALRQELKEKYKQGTVCGGFPSLLSKTRKRQGDPDVIINVGTTEDLTGFKGQVINPREMVQAASNKRKARVAFVEAEVPAPKLYLRAREVSTNDLPVVGRTSYHKKGQGFWFCKTKKALGLAVRAGATHFLQFIPRTREYRVHLFAKANTLGKKERAAEDYVSVKLAEKVWQGQGKPDPEQPQKNHEFGWVFLGQRDRRKEELDVVRFAAKQAIAAISMDFGAVDVMYRIQTKQAFVLEVNSTPCLADDNANTREVYADRILKILGVSGKEDKDE